MPIQIINFDLRTQAKAFAIFLAQLVREGITYKLSQEDNRIEIQITGGF